MFILKCNGPNAGLLGDLTGKRRGWKMKRKNFVSIIIGLLLCACIGITGFMAAKGENILEAFKGNELGQSPDNSKKAEEGERLAGKESVQARENDGEEDAGTDNIIQPSGRTLKKRVAVPDGYKRVACKKKSLGSFLRNYPMKKDGSPVLLYDGSRKGNQGAHVAVFKLPIEEEDLQQCADSIMRVYAEYFWKTGQKERIQFHFVDGFLADYGTWRDGGRIQAGNTTRWVHSSGYDDSYQNFKKYLRMVFAYAGTLSMEAESKRISLAKLQIGDIFIKGASPGHVVMVADVCQNEEGKRAFLLAQGYMPAQEFHLLKNLRHEEDPWYYEEEVSYPFQTPEYTFQKGSLRRLKY